MKKNLKKLLCAALALLLLCTVSLADVQTTGNVNLRKGPGMDFAIVATVKKGTVLTDLDCIVTDERGIEWYWVEYSGKECWVSSKYAEITSSDFEANTGYIALEGYYGKDIAQAAKKLRLPSFAFTGGELENSYYNDGLTILGNSVVECMEITGESYSLFGATLDMPWYDALNTCVHSGLYVIGAYADHIVLEREADVPDGMKSCVNLSYDADGLICGIGWSTYTSD